METTTYDTNYGIPDRAILASVVTQQIKRGPSDPEHSLEELINLAETAGVEVLTTMIQNRETPDPKWLIGKGKVEELRAVKEELGATTIICSRSTYRPGGGLLIGLQRNRRVLRHVLQRACRCRRGGPGCGTRSRQSLRFRAGAGRGGISFRLAPELAKELAVNRSIEPAGPKLQAFLKTLPSSKCGTIGLSST